MLIDTHCHIHEADFPLPIQEVLTRSHEVDVQKLICVGTSEVSSVEAIDFAKSHDRTWASVGVHPHDTKDGYGKIAELVKSSKRVVAVGEIGLDYFYTNSPKEVQMQALEEQIKIALEHHLPIIFHVRKAFEDFWPIFDKYPGVRGELHSFTDSKENLDKALERGLYIGVNGISTFTKDEQQKEMFDAIPLGRLLFETDAPFLTPVPFRGKVNEPAFVRNIAEYHAKRRGISLDEIATATSKNAEELFAI
jgi:TatD DNase family protein